MSILDCAAAGSCSQKMARRSSKGIDRTAFANPSSLARGSKRRSFQGVVGTGIPLAIRITVAYNRCMKKKRTSIYLDDKDKEALHVIRETYHLDSDAAAVRFVLHKEVKQLAQKGKSDEKKL